MNLISIFELQSNMKKYFSDIWEGVSSVLQGMKLTLRHLKNANHRHTPTNVSDKNYFLQDTGLVTLTYPYETLPVPDHGRYQLFNEMDDCIVCDKCAVICPVSCIAIDAIKSSEPIGVTSDGSVKRLYAAKFDIDMAKCCFCGLCTSVCPTECLTMTNQYDFSTYTVKEMNFEFANLSAAQAEEKRKLYEQYIKEKEEAKRSNTENTKDEEANKGSENISTQEKSAVPVSGPIKMPVGIKPVFKPVIKLPENKKIDPVENSANVENISKNSNIISKSPTLTNFCSDFAESEGEGTIGTGDALIAEPPIAAIPPVIKMPAGMKPVIKPVIKKPEPPQSE